jgi:ATP-binding cassette subfamily B protein
MSENKKSQIAVKPMGPGPMGGMGKAKDFKSTMKKLAMYLKPYSISIITVIIFTVAGSAFSVIGPKILGKATTKIFQGLTEKVSGNKGAGIDFDYISKIILILLGLYIISSLLSFIQGFIISGVSQRVSLNLRKDISEKINRMPLRYFDTKSHGEVMSRVTNDVDTVSQSLSQSLSQIITSAVSLIGILAMMLSISWVMTLAAILTVPLSSRLLSLILKKSKNHFKKQQQYLGQVNGQIEEIYGGHIIIKAFNGEEEVINDFDKLNNSLFDSAIKAQFLSGIMMPIMGFIGNIGYVLVSILGGWLAIKKTIEVGDILSFIQYVKQFNQPISQIAQISNVLQSTAVAAERVFEFLEEEEEKLESKNPASINKVIGEVSFEKVNFGYKPDKIIINDFSTLVKPGQKVAIVGPTGAGKTTIVKLLMRFYDVKSGAILIDGNDISDFKRDELRSMFGMVLQDTWLFNGSIMENIRYGKLTATDEEVIEAAKAAQVHHFVKTLPEGYDMILNEEASNISQGQKQLLTIARALLADPKILILDEATSSVDTRTEILIQKAMNNLMDGRTSFIIAHRLSTIKDADVILVMKDGDIVEQGKHDELMAANGFYASLYMSQFEVEQIT